MLQIDKIDDMNIRIRQGSIDVNVAAIFFASIGEESGMLTILPKSAIAYRSFSDLLENVEINGVQGSSYAPKDAVIELNSFIGNFRKGGSSSANNAVIVVLKVDTSISSTLKLQGVAMVDWGDGSMNKTDAATISHTYTQTGLFDVTVQITDIPNLFAQLQANVVAVSVPNKKQIKSFGKNAFDGCYSIALFDVNLSLITSIPYALFYIAFASSSKISLDFPNAGFSTIANQAFENSKLGKISFSPLSKITVNDDAFSSCVELTDVTFGKIISLGVRCFAGLSKLSNFQADFSEIISIPISAFENSLERSANLVLNFPNPNLTSISIGAFGGCKADKIIFSKESTINLDNSFVNNQASILIFGKITFVNNNTFNNANMLTHFEADLSLLTSLPEGSIYVQVVYGVFVKAFASGSMQELNFTNPNFNRVGNYAFLNSKIYKVSFNNDSVLSLGIDAFYGCTELEELNLGKVTLIETDALKGTKALKNIRIYAETPPDLQSVIDTTSLQAIYVPIESISAYQSNSQWSIYSSYFQGF